MAAKEVGVAKNRTIFQDVFRRADKNDDGALSWEEFKAFFSDGVASDEDLRKLFKEIDTHNTNNLDVGELYEFFTHHLGPFSEIFENLESTGASVTHALTNCHQKYPSSLSTEKFAVRFLLREVQRQFGFIQQHLETASESIDDEEAQKGQNETLQELEVQMTSKQRRKMRKMKSYQQQTSVQGPASSLENEVERLSELIDKLEGKISFEVVEEEYVEQPDDLLAIVSRKFSVDPSKSEDFKTFLRVYCIDIKKNHNCFGISIRIHPDGSSYTLFEVWRNDAEIRRHLVSSVFKSFQRQLIDCLLEPEEFSKLSLPSCWLKQK